MRHKGHGLCVWYSLETESCLSAVGPADRLWILYHDAFHRATLFFDIKRALSAFGAEMGLYCLQPRKSCGILPTQTLTHFPQNRPGAERADLRVLCHFRPQKARKALRRSGWRNRRQLITRRSLVQVQPPQPQKHRFPAGKRCFSFTFATFSDVPISWTPR